MSSRRQWIVTYLVITCAHATYQISSPNAETYVAAVVEYPPVFANNSEETLRINSDAYVKHIRVAGLNDVDIIVFPEDGLTTMQLPKREEMDVWTTVIPAATENYIPCDHSTVKVSEAMRKISCAAKENRIYVVINIAEKIYCTKSECTKDESIYYNSNVVFDRNGKIIARYRKTNLFREPQFNVTSVPEIVMFDTDFGVKFGTFICFDIMFHDPALQLTRFHHITDIAYPTAWFSEVPFLTAVQAHSGWAFAEDVNFLVSGYNKPTNASMGSGIFLGRKGIGKAIMPIREHEELLIFNVPKIRKITPSSKYECYSKNYEKTWCYHQGKEQVRDELRKKQENVKTFNVERLWHDNIQVFNTISLKGNITKNLCQNDFCCEFTVEITKIDPKTEYRLVVFSGIRKLYVIDVGIRACGVIQCSNDSVSSCGSVKQSDTVFSKIEIMATFHDYENIIIMPSTLGIDLLPLQETDWKYVDHINDNHVQVNLSLINSKSDIITFGMYSRYFNNK